MSRGKQSALLFVFAVAAFAQSPETYTYDPSQSLDPLFNPGSPSPNCTSGNTSPQVGPTSLTFTVNMTCNGGTSTAKGTVTISFSPTSITGTIDTALNTSPLVLTTPLVIDATANLTFTGSIASTASTLSIGGYTGDPSAPGTQFCYGQFPGTAPETVSVQNCKLTELYANQGTDGASALADVVLTFYFNDFETPSQAYVVNIIFDPPATTCDAKTAAGAQPHACTTPTITFDGMEVVQVIQNSSNGVPLVQGKTAEVRVFAHASQLTDVKATLFSTNLQVQTPPTTQGILGVSTPDPNYYTTVLYFEIGQPWVGVGPDTYQVIIDGLDSSGNVLSSVTATGSQPVTYNPTKWPQPYVVAPLRVCVAEPAPLSEVCPASWIEGLGPEIQAMFPVPDVSLYYAPSAQVSWDTTKTPLAKEVKKILLVNLVFKAWAILGKAEAPNQLVVWFPSGTGKLPAANTYPGVIFLTPVNFDSEFSITDWRASADMVASDIAQNLGAPMGGVTDLTGWDTDSGLLEAAGIPALNPDRINGAWPSRAQYTALLNAFNTSNATPAYKSSPAGSVKAAAASTSSQYLTITGDVAVSGSTADLDPGFLDSTGAPSDASDPNGNYCLQFSGPSGTLGNYCFTVNLQAGFDPAPFAVRAPWPAGANSVALAAAGGGTPLASITANAKQPTVQITSPAKGASLTGGTLNLSWTGTGASPLAYNLLYSSDGGTTWTPIDVGLTDTTYALDTTQINGGSQVEFQIQASDGLNTVTATVGPLTISQAAHVVPPQGTVNFNKVLIGQSANQQVMLQNTGTGPLTITGATSGGNFQVMANFPLTIRAGGQGPVTVRYTPTAAGVEKNTLSISSNDPAQPTVSVPLQAEAITMPESTVSLGSSNSGSTTVDFGNVVVGQSTVASFPVNSLGPATLNVSNFQSSNAAYTVASPTLPFSVAPGQSQNVTVKFAPSATGAQNATFTLTTDDPDTPSATVNATGTGVAANSGTPSFAPTSVVNAASGQGGGVAPGEVVLIVGSNLGPSQLAGLQLVNGAVATTIGNTQVLFDGVPAPMIYALAGQLAAVVPYEIWSETETQMQVVYNGTKSNVAALPVAATVPGIFTANSSGSGPAAALNQDGSVNSATNPAAPGSVLILYGTGEGQTDPFGVDGSVTGTVLPTPIASPVSVTIGGVNATVLYAGEAPGLVAGVLQVNVTVPSGVGGGNQPVVLTIGSASSPTGVTVAITGPVTCTYTLSRSSVSVASSASTGSFTVTASSSSCAWTAVSNATWLTVTTGASGTGSGTISYSVAANTGGARTGIISVSGQTYTVNQAAATPSIAVTPSGLNFSSVAEGTSKQASLTVSNTGGTALNVSALTAGGVFSVVSPATPFTVAAGSSSTVTLQFNATGAGGQSSTLTIVSNDPKQPNLAVPIWGTGYNPANVLTSDSFNRANATECGLGTTDLKFGGTITYQYLPDWPGTSSPIGASIVSGALQNNGLNFGGVQLTTSSDVCNTARGASLPQDLDVIVDVYVPGVAGGITDAGPYFRSRAAAPGDGIFGGTSSGYWVEVFSTGQVWVDQNNPFEPIAESPALTSFDPSIVHTLEARIQGTSLQAWLDGQAVTFTLTNGSTATTVPVSTAANNGTAGIIFGSEQNAGLAGGQSAKNLIISSLAAATAPQISVSTTSLNLGSVAVGQSANVTLNISNTGTAALNVTGIASSSAAVTIVSPAIPFTVQPGATTPVTVKCAPTAAGAVNGSLTITSNDPAHGQITVSFSGTGVAGTPVIGASTTSLAFGNVAVGQLSTLTFNVLNTGTAALTVSSVAISNPVFGLMTPAIPFTAQPGSTTPVTVVFGPQSAGAQSATFTVTSNDPAHPTVAVTLTGTGTGAPNNLLAYSNVVVGQSENGTLTFTNTGTTPLTVTSQTTTNGAFTVTSPSTPYTIPAGQSATIVIVFKPTSYTIYNATLSLVYGGGTSTTQLSGAGVVVQ